MQIRCVRSGGFGGISTSWLVDTDNLPAYEEQKVKKLVDAANFFSLPEKFPLPKRGADYYNYTLTVKHGSSYHTVEVSELKVPESLRPLIRYLVDSVKIT